eukprot:TRINITY_DN6522_c0_g2_i1.p1 TRINITY_DN6522_c0_g2~~TRINITY_DN6522_c0_g2_i1.p1  ORF type:complete len:287 (-),score=50.73 TRINITY_DN6522_c0_g2_i1:218-1000(-)
MGLETQPDEMEEGLFREGASNETMAAWQHQEEAHMGLYPRGTALSMDLEARGMQAVLKLAVSEAPLGDSSDPLELLEVGNLSLSVLSDLDANLALGGVSDRVNDRTARRELMRTCLAVSNLCCKIEFCTRARLCSVLGADCGKEREVLKEMGGSIWRPTAASWMRVFRTRLKAIRDGDMVQMWCDVSVQILQTLLMTSPQVVKLPQRHLAAGVFARAAESLGLEKALTSAIPFVTGLDAGTLAGAHVSFESWACMASEHA